MAAAAIVQIPILTLTELHRQVIRDEDTCIRWLRRHELLRERMRCRRCNRDCREEQSDRYKDGRNWRCGSCRNTYSIRVDSFFKGSHLPLCTLVHWMYYWCKGECKVEDIKFELGIKSNSTIVDWHNYFRDVCAEYYVAHPQVIGGPGHVVEIDESKFGKRKYNRGRLIEGHWVLGGIDRDTKQVFMQAVPQRDAATMLPIIQQYVRPGTFIITDCWRAYNRLQQLGYGHATVNHSRNFVDPVTGAHSNNIERYWNTAKRRYRVLGGTSNALFRTYLFEYVWRNGFARGSAGLTFVNFLCHIREQYPVQ